MDKIEQYVETVFTGVPPTPATVVVKQNILTTMTEKYRELISQGKNENEAFGIVISQFGNIDELRRKTGIASGQGPIREEPYRSPYNQEKRQRPCGGSCKSLSAVIFLSATIIFLCIGFKFSLWHPGWIIFLVAAFINVVADWIFKAISQNE